MFLIKWFDTTRRVCGRLFVCSSKNLITFGIFFRAEPDWASETDSSFLHRMAVVSVLFSLRKFSFDKRKRLLVGKYATVSWRVASTALVKKSKSNETT